MYVSRREFFHASAGAAVGHAGVPPAWLGATPGVQDTPSPGVSVKAFGAVGDARADDTRAVQAAIEAAAGRAVVFPPGQYLIAGLRLPSDVRLTGTSAAYSYLKVKPGFAGSAITDMGNGTRIQIENLVLDCTDQVAGNGIELGFTGTGANNEHNFLAWLRGVRVLRCPGVAFRIKSNVSELVDVWASYGNGTGMELEGTVVRAHRIACEGSRNHELLLRCTDAHLSGLHVETPVRENPILIDAYGAVLDGLTLSVDRDTTIADIIRLTPRSAGCELRGVRINLNQPRSDYVNLLRDDAADITITKRELSNPRFLGLYLQPGLPSYLGELRGATRFSGPVVYPPVTFSDGDSTPTVRTGALFKAANTRVTTITDFDQAVDGQEITVLLDGKTTVASNGSIKLQGRRSFRGRAGDTVTLVRADGVWHEKSRAAS